MAEWFETFFTGLYDEILAKAHGGRAPITDRDIRPICAVRDGAIQRRMWRKVVRWR